MINQIMDSYLSLVGGFLRSRTIRRLDDGCKVDHAKQKSLRCLPEHTLQDLGFYSAQMKG